MHETQHGGADEFEQAVSEQSGILTTRQAVDLVGRSSVRSRLRGERWRQVCRGVVSVHNGPLTDRQQLWVAVLLSGRGARLGGRTAAAEAAVQGPRGAPLQVVVPASRSRSTLVPRLPPDMPPVRVYRTAVLPPQHQHAGRPPRTTLARAIVDGASWARTDDEARILIGSACQQRRVEPAELRAVLDLLPRIRRHRLIQSTVADIEGGSQALSGIDLVRLCRRHRLPEPDRQVRRTDADGRERFVDAYWSQWHLVVEVDGAHPLGAQQWAAEMVRHNQIGISGDRILRFPAWLVRAHPAQVATQLRAALH